MNNTRKENGSFTCRGLIGRFAAALLLLFPVLAYAASFPMNGGTVT